MRVILIEHFIHERLGNIGHDQQSHTVDDHEPHAGQQQPQARFDQRFDLRPELLEVRLALGQIVLARARAASARRALGARAHIHPAGPHRPHALNLPRLPRDEEGAHAEEDINQQQPDHRQLRFHCCHVQRFG
jgi:hypothetical protein